MTTRKEFIKTIALASCALASSSIFSAAKTARERIYDEIAAVMKKYAAESHNEATCQFIEAEVSDALHMHVECGDIFSFTEICIVDEDNSLVNQCMIVEDAAIGKTVVIEMRMARWMQCNEMMLGSSCLRRCFVMQ